MLKFPGKGRCAMVCHARKNFLCHIGVFLSVAAALLFSSAQAGPAGAGSWYLDRNYVSLFPGNRFFDSIDVSNKSENTIFLKASVSRLMLVEGRRVTDPDAGEVLVVSPEEFAVGPGQTFPLRIIANPLAQANDSASYYLRLTDISGARAAGGGNATISGFSLAFEALTVVKKTPYARLTADSFSLLSSAGSPVLKLQNRSGQHLYLAGGYACDSERQALVDCSPLLGFPKQSLMPGETVQVRAEAGLAVLGLLLHEDLAFKTPALAIHVRNRTADDAGDAR